MPSWFARAQARIPGGVNSPVRAFGSVGGKPFFVAAAHGAYLVDTEGGEYLDYVQSWGASILGHADPAVVEAVQRAAAQLGWIDGTAVALEHLLAIKRAGADIVLTYFAREVAELLQAS